MYIQTKYSECSLRWPILETPLVRLKKEKNHCCPWIPGRVSKEGRRGKESFFLQSDKQFLRNLGHLRLQVLTCLWLHTATWPRSYKSLLLYNRPDSPRNTTLVRNMTYVSCVKGMSDVGLKSFCQVSEVCLDSLLPDPVRKATSSLSSLRYIPSPFCILAPSTSTLLQHPSHLSLLCSHCTSLVPTAGSCARGPQVTPIPERSGRRRIDLYRL